jgi:hypothetical protein
MRPIADSLAPQVAKRINPTVNATIASNAHHREKIYVRIAILSTLIDHPRTRQSDTTVHQELLREVPPHIIVIARSSARLRTACAVLQVDWVRAPSILYGLDKFNRRCQNKMYKISKSHSGDRPYRLRPRICYCYQGSVWSRDTRGFLIVIYREIAL